MAHTKTKAQASNLDGYLKLICQFPLRPVRTKVGVDRAIAMIDSLLDRDQLTVAEEDYLDVLSDLVEHYEDVRYPFVASGHGDAAMLRFLIDQRDVTQAAVAQVTGIAESRISEVLGGKRKLTRMQIEKLAGFFHVDPGVFLPGASNRRKNKGSA